MGRVPACTPITVHTYPAGCRQPGERDGMVKARKEKIRKSRFQLLADFWVTPERFTRNGVNYIVCQDFRLPENHGCSLFAHPDISMFFVYLQRKSSYNSLISGRFQC